MNVPMSVLISPANFISLERFLRNVASTSFIEIAAIFETRAAQYSIQLQIRRIVARNIGKHGL